MRGCFVEARLAIALQQPRKAGFKTHMPIVECACRRYWRRHGWVLPRLFAVAMMLCAWVEMTAIALYKGHGIQDADVMPANRFGTRIESGVSCRRSVVLHDRHVQEPQPKRKVSLGAVQDLNGAIGISVGLLEELANLWPAPCSCPRPHTRQETAVI